MIYLKKFKIIQQTYASNVIPVGTEFELSDVNLLVGNQGCGKSTLLKMIQQNHSDIHVELTEDTIKNGVSTFFFDSEKDNPRIKDPQCYADLSGNNIGIGYGNALNSRFKSHGEVIQQYTIDALKTAKNSVLLIDEPESGLSITNQFKLIKGIKKAVENGCQFFIATHCYPLIQEFDVISLEHLKKFSGNDFINKVK